MQGEQSMKPDVCFMQAQCTGCAMAWLQGPASEMALWSLGFQVNIASLSSFVKCCSYPTAELRPWCDLNTTKVTFKEDFTFRRLLD